MLVPVNWYFTLHAVSKASKSIANSDSQRCFIGRFSEGVF